jgi:hypothetical protein
MVDGPCLDPISDLLIPCPLFSVDAGSAIVGTDDPKGEPIEAASLLVPPGMRPIPPFLPTGCPVAGKPCVAIPALKLGLLPDDDLDALCWFDREEDDETPPNGLPDLPLATGGIDQYYFSLTPGSPTLVATGYRAGDILAPAPTGVYLAVYAGRLGLADGDNLDGLKCLDPDSDGDGYRDAKDNCPFFPTPWWVPPGDDDCDGFTTNDEIYYGTDPDKPCAATGWMTGDGQAGVDDEGLPDLWPIDFNDDQKAGMQDVIFAFVTTLAPDGLNQTATPPLDRVDFNGDVWINMQDVILGYVTRLAPNGLNTMCTPP